MNLLSILQALGLWFIAATLVALAVGKCIRVGMGE